MNQLSLDNNIPLRTHVTEKKLTKLIQKKYTQKITFKPFGFWISYKNDWLISGMDMGIPQDRYNKESYMYEIQFKNGIFTKSLSEIKKGKILKISTKNDLINFHNKYKHAVTERKRRYNCINWINVSKDFSGIEIVPYQHSLRMTYDWYYSFDVASGCIWDNAVFKKISLTHTFKVTKNEKILYNKLKNNEDIEIEIEILTKK